MLSGKAFTYTPVELGARTRDAIETFPCRVGTICAREATRRKCKLFIKRQIHRSHVPRSLSIFISSRIQLVSY